jgi:hypothetical protein
VAQAWLQAVADAAQARRRARRSRSIPPVPLRCSGWPTSSAPRCCGVRLATGASAVPGRLGVELQARRPEQRGAAALGGGRRPAGDLTRGGQRPCRCAGARAAWRASTAAGVSIR